MAGWWEVYLGRWRCTFVVDRVAELDGIVVILERLPDGFYFGEFFFVERSVGCEMEGRSHLIGG